jgi:transcriptional regulator
LQQRPQAVVTFLGAHAYLSPQVYPDLARVPTWNYLAVHCTVEATLIDEPEAKDALLKKLIGEHEPAYAEQWRGLAPDYQRMMLSAMVGFELRVTAFECKLKLNQHRPEAHEATVKMYAGGSEDQRTLAEWMQRLKAEKTSGTSGAS